MARVIRFPLLQYLVEVIGALFSQVCVTETSSPTAYKSYERKAAHDFYACTGAPLQKHERFTKAALMCLDECNSVDEAIAKLKERNSDAPKAFCMRIAYIWQYYEFINQ